MSEKALIGDRESSKRFLKEADRIADTGDFQQAINLYRKAINADHTNYIAYYNKGVAHMEIGQYKRAADEFAYYLTKVDDPDGWLNFAVCLNHIHKYEEALMALERCGDGADVEFNRGISLHSLRRFEEAEHAFKKALELEQATIYNYYLANLYADMGKFAKAVEIYETLTNEKEIEEEVLYNLANCLVDLGEKEEAIKIYRRILNQNNSNWKALFNLAFALEGIDPEEAIEKYEKVIEIKPELHEAHYNIACVLAREGREGWKKHLQNALEMSRGEYIESLENDLDFEEVRTTSEFSTIVQMWKKHAK